MKKYYNISFLLVFFITSFSFSQNLSSIRIGNQTWTDKNLSVEKFRNGEVIKESKNKEDWYKAGFNEEATWCYYNFDEKYSYLGKLYNYFAISSVKNIAPKGWKVPSYFDYFDLIKYLDPLITHDYLNNNGSLAGGALKIQNSEYWKNVNCKQINSKFNAIPSGGYKPSLNYPDNDWCEFGKKSRFWCITKWNEIINKAIKDLDKKKELLNELNNGRFYDKAIVIRLSDKNCEISMDDDPKLNGYSLRLIKVE